LSDPYNRISSISTAFLPIILYFLFVASRVACHDISQEYNIHSPRTSQYFILKQHHLILLPLYPSDALHDIPSPPTIFFTHLIISYVCLAGNNGKSALFICRTANILTLRQALRRRLRKPIRPGTILAFRPAIRNRTQKCRILLRSLRIPLIFRFLSRYLWSLSRLPDGIPPSICCQCLLRFGTCQDGDGAGGN